MDSRFTVTRMNILETSVQPPTDHLTKRATCLNVPSFLIDMSSMRFPKDGSKNGSIIQSYSADGKLVIH